MYNSRDVFRKGAVYISAKSDMPYKDQAKAMGITKGRFCDLLKGRKPWTDGYKEKFCKAHGLSVQTVLLIGVDKA